MSLDTVSILDGSTFVVSDRRGDLDATPTENHGLFLEDTRFLSKWILTVGGIRPKTLSVDEQAYFKVQFFEAVTTGTVYVDSHLSVTRQRQVTTGFEDASKSRTTPRTRSIWRSSWRSRPTSRICSRSRTSWRRRAACTARWTAAS